MNSPQMVSYKSVIRSVVQIHKLLYCSPVRGKISPQHVSQKRKATQIVENKVYMINHLGKTQNKNRNRRNAETNNH